MGGAWIVGAKVNGACNGLGEITKEGMFDDGVYEVSRGGVDNNLNLTKQKEYSVDIYDEDLFKEFYIKVKKILYTIMVAEYQQRTGENKWIKKLKNI